jgi:hypothetical protein
MIGSQLFIYAMSILFLIIYTVYAKHRGSLNEYQRMELIISSGLYIVVFGLIASRILYDPILELNISIGSLAYINWYYWTYTIVNSLNTNEHGITLYT